MNIVIDTHIFLWLVMEPNRISKQQRLLLSNPKHSIFITNLSFWEIALKYQTGKLDLQGFLPHELPKVALSLDLQILNIVTQSMASSYQLLSVKDHTDPFDRLIVWFCIENNYTLVSLDTVLNRYKEQGLKIVT